MSGCIYSRSNKKPYEVLANEIVRQACEDYDKALRKGDSDMIADCEKFFRSRWMEFLSDADGPAIIRAIKERVERDADNNLSDNSICDDKK